ncbi:MAG TPA: multiheme c-type cytochrome [Planctomycetaceae bacterium]|nr:multiheme c-type cytochrome [Planctomycetaceae bacterium]HRA86531.1 multiheme c-type cytochrome [Planctomycetaceae bacterium]
METPKSLKARFLLPGTAGAVLIIGIWWLLGKSASPPDPPDPPALIASEPRILGSAKCGECHEAELTDYLSSGHSKTLWSTRDFPFRDRFKGMTFEDVDRQEMYHYFLGERGMEVIVPGKFGRDRFPLQFAFGSGEHALTFVTLTPDGTNVPTGVEHRVSWFTGLDRADLTPGQLGMTVHQDIEYFGRVMRGTTLERCFECHTTSGRIEGDQLVELIPNVGCENCHTGGALHADVMQARNPTDSDTGFEKRPWRTTDQIQICAQCHRSVDSVKKSQITRENWKIVRYQPVGLVQSKCYVQSGQKLLCSTCHNPHQHAASQTTEQYEKKCLQCHSASPDSVRCSVSPDFDCVSCHMPSVEVHPSISFHDHWIRVRNDADTPAVQSETDVRQ